MAGKIQRSRPSSLDWPDLLAQVARLKQPASANILWGLGRRLVSVGLPARATSAVVAANDAGVVSGDAVSCGILRTRHSLEPPFVGPTAAVRRSLRNTGSGRHQRLSGLHHHQVRFAYCAPAVARHYHPLVPAATSRPVDRPPSQWSEPVAVPWHRRLDLAVASNANHMERALAVTRTVADLARSGSNSRSRSRHSRRGLRPLGSGSGKRDVRYDPVDNSYRGTRSRQAIVAVTDLA